MGSSSGVARKSVQATLTLAAAAALLVVAGAPAHADASADLSVTMTDDQTTAVPGGSVSYTVTVVNSGSDSAAGAAILASFPGVNAATWTCLGSDGATCAASSGDGSIDQTASALPAGGTITFTALGTIDPAATGNLTANASATTPSGVVDPTPGNNSASDVDVLEPSADLSISGGDGITTAVAGSVLTYTISVSNSGPSSAHGAKIADAFSGGVASSTWSCVGSNGAACTNASGSGSLTQNAALLPPNGSLVFTVRATVARTMVGVLTNDANVNLPVGLSDPSPVNNSVSDTTLITAAPKTNQSPVAVKKTLKVRKSFTVAGATTAGIRISVRSSKPSICKVARSGSKWKVTGKRAGSCSLTISNTGSTLWNPLRQVAKVRVKR